MPDFQDIWIGKGWKLRVDVGADSSEVPFGGVAGPLPPERTDVVSCVDTVNGRPIRITTYREAGADLHGDFIVTGVWPLTKETWIRASGAAVDIGRQRLLASVLRTLRLDTVSGANPDRRPSSQCPNPGIDTSRWSRIRLRFAPVTLLLPVGGLTHRSEHPSMESLEWPSGRSVINYRLYKTIGWQLPKVTDPSAIWCRFSIDGGQGGIRIVQIRGAGLPRLYEERATISIAPNEVLDVRGQVLRADTTSLDEFIKAMTSMRLAR